MSFNDIFLAPPIPGRLLDITIDNIDGRYIKLTPAVAARFAPSIPYQISTNCTLYGASYAYTNNVDNKDIKIREITHLSDSEIPISKLNGDIWILAIRRGKYQTPVEIYNCAFDIRNPHCISSYRERTHPRYDLQTQAISFMVQWTHADIPMLAHACNIPDPCSITASRVKHPEIFLSACANRSLCGIGSYANAITTTLLANTSDLKYLRLKTKATITHDNVVFKDEVQLPKHDSYHLIRKMYAWMRARLVVLLRRYMHRDVARVIVRACYPI